MAEISNCVDVGYGNFIYCCGIWNIYLLIAFGLFDGMFVIWLYVCDMAIFVKLFLRENESKGKIQSHRHNPCLLNPLPT